MPSYGDLWVTVNRNTFLKLPPVFDITISQGSVTTRLRCGGIFSDHFTANLSPSLRKNFANRLRFDKVTAVSLLVQLFLEHSVELTRMWANVQRDGRPAEYR